MRINCLSTEFSSQKGVKGLPLHIVVDTYEDIETEREPSHRAYCRVKIFRDKVSKKELLHHSGSLYPFSNYLSLYVGDFLGC